MVLFRYFEARGNLLKAISVAKSRTSRHANTIHEFASATRAWKSAGR